MCVWGVVIKRCVNFSLYVNNKYQIVFIVWQFFICFIGMKNVKRGDEGTGEKYTYMGEAMWASEIANGTHNKNYTEIYKRFVIKTTATTTNMRRKVPIWMPYKYCNKELMVYKSSEIFVFDILNKIFSLSLG